MRILPVVIPDDKLIFISVQTSRCIVARYVQTGPAAFEVRHATNWQTLEDDARTAVDTQSGAGEDGHYPCPAALAVQAVFQ